MCPILSRRTFFLCNLHTTTVANNTLVTNTFVFSAGALIIFYRPENSFAKQAISFRLVSAVINCFRLQYFTISFFLRIASGEDKPDCNLRKCWTWTIFFFYHIFIISFEPISFAGNPKKLTCK